MKIFFVKKLKKIIIRINLKNKLKNLINNK